MITIRDATKADVPDLQSLNDDIFIENPRYDPDLDKEWAHSEKGHKYFTTIVQDPDALCMIAVDGAKKVGYIAASPKPFSFRHSRYLEIENMGVVPEYRSQGVGGMLIEKCIKWARSSGFQRIYVTSYFQNKKAISFYQKNGFSEIDISLERDI